MRLCQLQYYPPARVQKIFLPGGGLPGGRESRATDQGGQIYHRHRYKRAQPHTEPHARHPITPLPRRRSATGGGQDNFPARSYTRGGTICNFRESLKKGYVYAIFAVPKKRGYRRKNTQGRGGGLIATRSATRDRRPAPREFSHNSNRISYQGEGAKSARLLHENGPNVDFC